ncbi:MAG: DNA polymerase IV [Desulfobacterales bacterium]|nr:DNA polymerase IV [Desulfobacterales bacterium]
MILHIDMDAFFAAVEQRDNPELRGKPIVVSGNSKRSVVSTASYEARKFGIHSAMPLFQAKQRCRHLIVVPGSKGKYSQVSAQIMAIFQHFSPLVEPVSIDEAYVDITGCETLFGPPHAIARKIKDAVYRETGLTCSIGCAPVKFLAKIASDMNKPNGLTLISPEEMPRIIEELPIGKIPGVGKQAMHRMDELGITRLGDVRQISPAILDLKFGKFGGRLHQLAQGIDETPVDISSKRKSISSETTLGEDIYKPKTIEKILLAHAQRVGRDLRGKKMVCRNVSIKIKFSDFTQITRSRKTENWICASSEIYAHALELYKKVPLKKKIRLLGVGVSHLRRGDTPVQMELLAPPESQVRRQWETVDKAVDSISEKFGTQVVTLATLNSKKKK